uniref:Large ribosomal subunit protein mL50 n=1 Tax=Romanomermis culicivorax TaxID=13658 RepID=A0A915I4N4_ROMCU
MRRSLQLKARWNFSLKGIFGRRKVEESSQEEFIDAEEENDAVKEESLAEILHVREIDVKRARGFHKHIKPYDPPMDLERKLKEIFVQYTQKPPTNPSSNNDDKMVEKYVENSWKNFHFENLDQKFQILRRCEQVLGKKVLNSHLHEMNSGQDLLSFFRQPCKITADYNDLANSDANNKPKNLHIIEEVVRYDPQRDGPPAFPLQKGYTKDLRYASLYKPIETKSQWQEFGSAFDDTLKDKYQSPEDAPWHPDNAAKLDSLQIRKPKYAV